MDSFCPDPVAFAALQARMPQITIGGVVALALFGVAIWLARPQGWRLRLASALSAALTLGVTIAAHIIRAQLAAAATRIDGWLPAYPADCDPAAFSYPDVDYPALLKRHLTTIAAPPEQAATITQWLALAALAALILCAYASIRAYSVKTGRVRMAR